MRNENNKTGRDIIIFTPISLIDLKYVFLQLSQFPFKVRESKAFSVSEAKNSSSEI